MSQDLTPASSWEAVAAELRAYREQQKQTWGDLDHALLGRYLAGEVSPEERTRVESQLADHPELRVLTDVVSGVLADVEAVPPLVQRPRILSLSAARPAGKGSRTRFRQLASLAAAASVLLGLGLALQSPSGPSSPDRLPAGSGELVAMATRFVDEGNVEQAAEVLFAPSSQSTFNIALQPGENVVSLKVDAPAAPAAPGGMARHVRRASPSVTVTGDAKPYIRTVARMAHKVLLDEKHAPSKGHSRFSHSSHDRTRTWILKSAVKPLEAGLTWSDDPQLQRDCAATLGSMGPTARSAAEKLQELSVYGCKEVQVVARQALHSVNQPDWVGLRDDSGALSAKARARINTQLETLSRKYHMPIVAEAVKRLPDVERNEFFRLKDRHQRAGLLGEVAQRRAREVGADHAVFLYICMDPPGIRVAPGQSLLRKDVRAPVALAPAPEVSPTEACCTAAGEAASGSAGVPFVFGD